MMLTLEQNEREMLLPCRMSPVIHHTNANALSSWPSWAEPRQLPLSADLQLSLRQISHWIRSIGSEMHASYDDP